MGQNFCVEKVIITVDIYISTTAYIIDLHIYIFLAASTNKKELTANDEAKRIIVDFLEDKNEFFSFEEMQKMIHFESDFHGKTLKQLLQELVEEDAIHCAETDNVLYFWKFSG